MESFENIQNIWNTDTAKKDYQIIMDKDSLGRTILSRMKKERKILMEYFWASFAYQILIYAFMLHLFIRFWGDPETMLISLITILLYSPFTFIQLKKFKAFVNNHSSMDLSGNLQMQYMTLSEFFKFKKRFELISVPVSCFVIVFIIFRLSMIGRPEDNLIVAGSLFSIWILLFVISLFFENKKRFKDPLNQYKLLLREMES
ncbi:MAG: hypothetical protein HOP08_10195 [Cyclobacteriaceae bacterium]|nr:hypothetical protein [Cyclobacteriaceae bacterium]